MMDVKLFIIAISDHVDEIERGTITLMFRRINKTAQNSDPSWSAATHCYINAAKMLVTIVTHDHVCLTNEINS